MSCVRDTGPDVIRSTILVKSFAKYCRCEAGEPLGEYSVIDYYIYFLRGGALEEVGIAEVKVRDGSPHDNRIPMDVAKYKALMAISKENNRGAFFIVAYPPGDMYYLDVRKFDPTYCLEKTWGRNDRGEVEKDPAYFVHIDEYVHFGVNPNLYRYRSLNSKRETNGYKRKL
jgi:hypothetical protein